MPIVGFALWSRGCKSDSALTAWGFGAQSDALAEVASLCRIRATPCYAQPQRGEALDSTCESRSALASGHERAPANRLSGLGLWRLARQSAHAFCGARRLPDAIFPGIRHGRGQFDLLCLAERGDDFALALGGARELSVLLQIFERDRPSDDASRRAGRNPCFFLTEGAARGSAWAIDAAAGSAFWSAGSAQTATLARRAVE